MCSLLSLSLFDLASWPFCFLSLLIFIGFVVGVIKSVALLAIAFGVLFMVYSGLYAVMDVVHMVMVIKLAILKMSVMIVSVYGLYI